MTRSLAVLVLVALIPMATRAESFCPPEGRVEASKAPSDFPTRPDAKCLVGGLVYLVGPDGTPYPQMTRLPPGWFFTAEGYELADAAFRRRGVELNMAQATANACYSGAGEEVACGTSSTGQQVQQPAPSSTGVLVALGVGLLVGAVGGAYLTARALR